MVRDFVCKPWCLLTKLSTLICTTVSSSVSTIIVIIVTLVIDVYSCFAKFLPTYKIICFRIIIQFGLFAVSKLLGHLKVADQVDKSKT